MPGDGANRAARIAQALQWDGGRWIGLLILLLMLDLLSGLGDIAAVSLRYDRAALAAGQWWRLLSAHAVHLDVHHLILNELGLILVWSLFAREYDAVEWCVIACSGALAISCGLWWLSPQVAWYVGASGVLHTVMAAGTVKHLLDKDWDRWILLAGLSVKLAYERWLGGNPPLVVVDAHLYGAAAGFAVGAALCWRMAIIRLLNRA